MSFDDGLIDQLTMSKMCLIKTKTAETWRHRGFGPPYIKIGSLVRYRKSDVEKWIAQRTRKSTSQTIPDTAA